MADDTKITFCPNCQQPAVRSGNEITCEKCDATFTITKKDGAKVKETGRIEKIEFDIAELRAQIFPDTADEPEPESEPKPADEQEPDESEGDW